MVEIPQAIKDKASKTLETIRLTGLEPSSLEEAGLMALSLRQFYLAKQSWAEAAQFLATPRNNLNLWQAAFACAPALLLNLLTSCRNSCRLHPNAGPQDR